MNPVFIILVLLVAVLLWFLLSAVFRPVGKIIYRLWKDAVDIMNKDDEEKENEKE